MGLMRFIVQPPDRITEDVVEQAYLCGPDRVPWEVEVSPQENELWVERSGSDSGCLHVPWVVEGYGQLMLSTPTLRERPEPYYLPLELARGKLSQVRDQLADWQAAGLEVPPEVQQSLSEGVRWFGKAACGNRESAEAVAAAERALISALRASEALVSAYTEQALAIRHRLGNRITTVLGADLGQAPLDEYAAMQFRLTFSAAKVPMVWREVETGEGQYAWDLTDRQVQWCRARGLTVCAGPLVNFYRPTVPDWLQVCEGDFESILAFATEYIQAAVDRYRGQVDYWHCVGRANRGDVLSLSEEEEIRLTARAIEVTRARDPTTPILISFDQPWGEYLSRRPKDFPPLQFADMLLRAGVGLSGIGLEINVGYWPEGTPLRDPLEFSRGIDYWGLLGVPLFVMLTYPSSPGADPLAQCKTRLPAGNWTPAGQQAWVGRYLPVLLSKPLVQGIFWNQCRDWEPHPFPHGGLFDLRRHPKPVLRYLASIRQAHLR